MTLSHRPGVVTTITVLAITGVVMIAFLTLTTLATSQFTQTSAIEDSEQTFYAAESGMNVALNDLRTSAVPTIPAMTINGATVNVTVDVGSTPYERIITSVATHPQGQERTLRIKVTTSTYAAVLNLAMHAGAGGFTFENENVGTGIFGDVHSNGNALPDQPGNQGNVYPVPDDLATPDNESILYPGNLTVSGSGNQISQMLISGTAWAHTLMGTNSKHLESRLTKYQTIPGNPSQHVYGGAGSGLVQCQTGVTVANKCLAGSNVSPDQPLPVDNAQIVQWATAIKNAANGGALKTSAADRHISGNVTWTGATKVIGDVTFDNNAQLTVTGPLWVLGNLAVSNNNQLELGGNALVDQTVTISNGSRLDLSPSLGENDGLVIAGDPQNASAVNGKIVASNGVMIEGSGNSKSSLTMISTNTSLDKNAPAIEAANTALGVIYYALDGIVRVKTTGNLNAVYANKIYLDANAKITFKPSLEFFTVPNPNPTPNTVQPGTWNEL